MNLISIDKLPHFVKITCMRKAFNMLSMQSADK